MTEQGLGILYYKVSQKKPDPCYT